METRKFKALLKQAVKEAIQEELKDILLEAIRTPQKNVVTEQVQNKPYSTIYTPQNGTITATSTNIIGTPGYRPITSNTAAEGSSLGTQEVSLEQIMGLVGSRYWHLVG